jgi:hypothetical protein
MSTDGVFSKGWGKPHKMFTNLASAVGNTVMDCPTVVDVYVEAYIALHLQIILMFSINIGYIYSLFQF